MTIKTLISTCIEFEENKSLKNTYFAGDWCFKDKKFIISNKNIFQNVWDNPKKIVRDFSKRKKIHKKFRNSLSFYLYNLNKKKNSKDSLEQFSLCVVIILFIFLLF